MGRSRQLLCGKLSPEPVCRVNFACTRHSSHLAWSSFLVVLGYDANLFCIVDEERDDWSCSARPEAGKKLIDAKLIPNSTGIVRVRQM